MPQLDELLTSSSVKSLHEKFVEGVSYLPRSDKGDFGLTKKTYSEVGEAICEYVHRRLWDSSAPAGSSAVAKGFLRRSSKTPYDVLIQAGVIRDGDFRHPRLSHDITRILTKAGLMARIPGSNNYLLRPWNPESLRYVSGYKAKIDPREEKRIEAEADKPVRSITDLRVIKMPDSPTPDAILEFIERFVPAALKIQEERDKLQAQLEAEAQKAEQGAWNKASDRIHELLKGKG